MSFEGALCNYYTQSPTMSEIQVALTMRIRDLQICVKLLKIEYEGHEDLMLAWG